VAETAFFEPRITMQNERRHRPLPTGNAHARKPPCCTCDDTDQSWVATTVVLALAPGGEQSFDTLLRSTGAAQATLTAALSQLRGDDWLHQNEHGDFRLSSRGLDLVERSRPQRGRPARRAA
jgi:hypothetical protein